ncbi:MAG: hypothetical protein B6D58_08605 [candidate division Zixibacteria bacterium 4484_95]|nr:MAG: hypothetical protein B6D58_08605 [candidate division Zixibacteria bacterium 4484_95]
MNPGDLNLISATIGIENYNASDGLQIVYNSSYMHNNLAIDISSGWLFASPSSGTVDPHDSFNATITFDATVLDEGIYTGNINLESNDPVNPDVDIPCTFVVATAPVIDVGALSILSPPDSMQNGTAYPLISEITNFGTESQSFDVVYEIKMQGDPTVLVADTLGVTDLAPGVIDTLIFSPTFTPVLDTAYNLISYTMLGGDQNNSNDTTIATCHSYSIVELWYGNLDSSPIIGLINDRVNVDVYIQTPENAYIADLHLCLGTENQYIDSLLSDTEGEMYYPLTEWDDASFLPSQGSPPNPAGWSSQSFLGWADLFGEPNPWLHFETPTRIMTFVVKTVNDTLFVGDTVQCFAPGINTSLGGSAAGDTLGRVNFPLIEHFSPMILLHQPVIVWYGNLDGSPVVGLPDSRISINTYIQTPEDAYIADMHLCLGVDNQYIDSLLSDTEGELFYPLTEWDDASFLPSQGSPPNPAGWSSQSFLGWADLFGGSNPWLHFDTPTRIMRFVVKAVDDPNLIGDTVQCFAPGVNIPNGGSTAGDTLGLVTYFLFENFSRLYFGESSGCDYIPGDINGDGEIMGLDVTYGVRYFKGLGDPPPDSCWNDSSGAYLYAAGDVNGSCEFSGSDITYLVAFFKNYLDELLWCPWTPPLNPPISFGKSDDETPVVLPNK